MKPWLIVFLALSLQTSLAQNITLGYLGGRGISDFHGKTVSDRWQSVTGPVNGIFFRFALSPVLSVGTELNYTTQGYYYKTYGLYYNYYPYLEPFSSTYVPYYPYGDYTKIKERWEYEFIRVPLYLTLSTPTRLQLSVSAGVYISFKTNDEYIGPVPYPYPYFYNSIYYDYRFPQYRHSNKPKHDNGLWYAASLSYPVNDNFRLYAMGRYAVGRRDFVAAGSGKTGVSELTFGLAYTGLFRSGNAGSGYGTANIDTSRFMVRPKSGVTVSWIRNSENPSHYSSKTSFSAGIELEYLLNQRVSFVTGIGFERKGYQLTDSTAVPYIHSDYEGSAVYNGYYADTQVDLDYAVLPLILKIRAGSFIRMYLEGGIYAGFNLNARCTGDASWEYFSENNYSKHHTDVYQDISSEVNEFEIGWICGAGFDVPLLKSILLNMGVTYASGTKDIFEKDEANNLSTESIRNGSLNIQFGLVLSIKSSE